MNCGNRYILFSFASFAEHDGVKDANFSRDQLMYTVCYSWRNLVVCLSLFEVQTMITYGKKPLVPCEFVAVDLLFCFRAACVFLLNNFLIPLRTSLVSQGEKKNLKKMNKLFISVLCRSPHIQLIWSTTLLKALQYVRTIVPMGWAELTEVSHFFCFSCNLKVPNRTRIFGHQLFIPYSSQYGIKLTNVPFHFSVTKRLSYL